MQSALAEAFKTREGREADTGHGILRASLSSVMLGSASFLRLLIRLTALIYLPLFRDANQIHRCAGT